MARTTAKTVEEVLLREYDVVNKPSLNIYIRMGNALTSRMVTFGTQKGVTYTSEELILIESLLSAHFYQSADPGYTEKESHKSRGVHTGQFGMGLRKTRFGQDAITMDPHQVLDALDRGAVASITWLGLPPSEQTDYVDRD